MRLREHRAAAGLTLRELSDRSGVSIAHLSRLERGLQDPTTNLLEAIADALEVELIDLLIDPDASTRHQVIARTADLTDDQLGDLVDLIETFDDHGTSLEPSGVAQEPPSREPRRTSGPRRTRRRRER